MSTTTYPCRQCGAKLEFAPGQQALKCPYCGSENAIAKADAETAAVAVEELDYQAYLARAAGNEPQIERQSVKCPGCGAVSQLPANTTADRCPFCAVPLIAAEAYAQRTIQPRAVAPFAVKEVDARQRFKDWIGGLWFAPNALKRAYRAATGIKGIYLPYWTYDAGTESRYRAERGDYYYETESYTENGETRTREVRRTRWTSVSGEVAVAFDDVMVPASASLPRDYLDNLEPWRLGELQPYREDYLSGFTVEAYQLGLEPGFTAATERMQEPIRKAVLRDIGGDEQRIYDISPRYYDITFKHILLPIWLSSYQYGGKTWRFVVNGQTGEVQGERPWSAWKITFAVLLGLIALFIFFSLASRH